MGVNMEKSELLDAQGEPIRGEKHQLPPGVRLALQPEAGRIFLRFDAPTSFVGLSAPHTLRLADAMRTEAEGMLRGRAPFTTPPVWLTPLLQEIAAYLEEMSVYFGEDGQVPKTLCGRLQELLSPCVPETK